MIAVFTVGIGMLPMMILGGLLVALFVLLLAGKEHSGAVRKVGRVILYVLFGALGLLSILFVLRMGFASAVHTGPGQVRAVGTPVLFVFPLATVVIVLTVLLVNKKTRKRTAYVLLAIALIAAVGFFVSIPVQTRHVVPEPIVNTPVVPERIPLAAIAPIWSKGIDTEFYADIYPSRDAAVRALGRRLEGPLRGVATESNDTNLIAIFGQDDERRLAGVLAVTLTEVLPEIHTAVEFGQRNLAPNEVGVELRQVTTAMPQAPWSQISGQETASQGYLVATAFSANTRTTISESFIEKPWVEDFSIFANSHPKYEFAVARSNEACTSESEARQQALAEATRLVGQAVGDHVHGPGSVAVSPADLQNRGIVADTFIQSFDGTAGPIWRQAVLLDLSPERLTTLAQAKTVQVQAVRKTWVVLIGQALGVFVVIFLVYLFLNMATRGYYDWALRIACFVLAIVVMAFLLLHA